VPEESDGGRYGSRSSKVADFEARRSMVSEQVRRATNMNSVRLFLLIVEYTSVRPALVLGQADYGRGGVRSIKDVREREYAPNLTGDHGGAASRDTTKVDRFASTNAFGVEQHPVRS